MTQVWPTVAVIIPHWKGAAILQRCLASLETGGYPGVLDVAVVNNASPDGSMDVVKYFPWVRVVESPVNRGYAGGCNLGIQKSDAPYVVLLNDDAVVTPGWLTPMVQALLDDDRIAAAQPKILSIQDPTRFDYCGAAGGEMDQWGYPFARGRLFETLEQDSGQYDGAPSEIFWASGAACLLRRSALDEVGLLEEAFFAHMEEIDLDWRLHWAGYRIVAAPQSVVHHQTGGTLASDRLSKMVLNHRNNLIMLLRNLGPISLIWIWPVRLGLECATLAWALVSGQFKRALAVLLGLVTLWGHGRTILRGRRNVAALGRISESAMRQKFYGGVSPLDYYLRGRRTAMALWERRHG